MTDNDRMPENSDVDPSLMLTHAKSLQNFVCELYNLDPKIRFRQHMGLFIAVPILLTLATEIVLKAYQLKERGEYDHSHDLLKLFRGLEKNTQKSLKDAFSPNNSKIRPILRSLEGILAIHRDTFINWRYQHETSGEFYTDSFYQVLKTLIEEFEKRFNNQAV